jgi:hypothetical protein
LPHWMFGSILIVPLAVYGLWQRRREVTTVLLATIGVLFPLAYLFYWGNLLIVNGRKSIGPHYYMAVMVPTVVFAAVALERLAQWRRSATVVLFVAMIVATAIELPDKIDRNQNITDAYRAEQDAIDAVVGPESIVILPITPDGSYLLHPRGWLTNDPELRDSILYAADRGPENVELVRRFPARRLYRLQAVESSRSPLAFRPSVREVVAAKAPTLRRTLRAPIPEEFTHVNAFVQTTADNRQGCVVTPSGATARIDVQMRSGTVELMGCADGPINLTVAAAPATLIVGFELLNDESRRSEFRELHVWTSTEGPDIVSLNDETWRIVPNEPIPVRVVEGGTDLVVTN